MQAVGLGSTLFGFQPLLFGEHLFATCTRGAFLCLGSLAVSLELCDRRQVTRFRRVAPVLLDAPLRPSSQHEHHAYDEKQRHNDDDHDEGCHVLVDTPTTWCLFDDRAREWFGGSLGTWCGMYIGIGTVVLILVILLIVMLLRGRTI
jgi:hypothetical protein